MDCQSWVADDPTQQHQPAVANGKNRAGWGQEGTSAKVPLASRRNSGGGKAIQQTDIIDHLTIWRESQHNPKVAEWKRIESENAWQNCEVKRGTLIINGFLQQPAWERASGCFRRKGETDCKLAFIEKREWPPQWESYCSKEGRRRQGNSHWQSEKIDRIKRERAFRAVKSQYGACEWPSQFTSSSQTAKRIKNTVPASYYCTIRISNQQFQRNFKEHWAGTRRIRLTFSSQLASQ